MGPDTTLGVRGPLGLPTPPHPLVQAGRQRLRSLSNETRWVLGGLLLAQAMVAVFYLILVHNMNQQELKRAAAESEARERHGCALIQLRLMRDQCFAQLATSRPVEVLATAPKLQD